MPDQIEISPPLYQQVADHIAEPDRAGKFRVGTRLPPERDLADRFEVSRPTVREALVALEIAGLIEVRTSSGAYVCPRPRVSVARTARRSRMPDQAPSSSSRRAA